MVHGPAATASKRKHIFLKKIKGVSQGGSYEPLSDGNFPLLAVRLHKLTLVLAEVDLRRFIICRHAQPVVHAWLYFYSAVACISKITK